MEPPLINILPPDPRKVTTLEPLRPKQAAAPTQTAADPGRPIRHLDGFDWEGSAAWGYLVRTFGPKVKHNELLSIAVLISRKTPIKVDRDAKRRKVAMIKWFDEHWDDVYPLLKLIVLEDRDNDDYHRM
jgi:hypothetical protein